MASTIPVLSALARERLNRVAVPMIVSLLLKRGYRNTMLFGPRPAAVWFGSDHGASVIRLERLD